MRFDLQRLYYTKSNPAGNYSLGFLTNQEETFRSLVLEDRHQDKKIAGETRIPAGFYPLGLRMELTPLTIKNREAYAKFRRPDGLPSFFQENPEWFHVEILNVPDFSGTYIHGGNDDEHTRGCPLPCYAFDMTAQDKPSSKSLLAVDDFYRIVHPILITGGLVHLAVHNETKFATL